MSVLALDCYVFLCIVLHFALLFPPECTHGSKQQAQIGSGDSPVWGDVRSTSCFLLGMCPPSSLWFGWHEPVGLFEVSSSHKWGDFSLLLGFLLFPNTMQKPNFPAQYSNLINLGNILYRFCICLFLVQNRSDLDTKFSLIQ